MAARPTSSVSAGGHAERMDAIYRRQRHIYDLTRKYYLLGRDRLIGDLTLQPGQSVLELGCGTGRNLALIGRRYPDARLFGLDISDAMLTSARKTLARSPTAMPPVLVRGDAGRLDPPADFGEPGFDRIVLSYALSMIPPWRAALSGALDALGPDGRLHIVDFGQQERLPRAFRAGLHAWLARFDVCPRADLVAVAESEAEERGMQMRFTPLFAGYAWSLVIGRANWAAPS